MKLIYYQNDDGLHGRYQAEDALSGQGMLREIRSTIFEEYYYDIDIVNCHPVIIQWICCNLGIECLYLNTYIANRDKCIYDLIQLNPELNKEDIKRCILAINNGGDKDFKKIKNKTTFIENYYIELTKIGKLICSKLFKFYEINEAFKDDDFNLVGSTMSYICQFVENQLLMKMHEYLETKIKSDIKHVILCFDGIMTLKNTFKCYFINDLEKIFSDMDINIKLKVKEMAPMDLQKYGYSENKKYKYIFTSDNEENDKDSNYLRG